MNKFFEYKDTPQWFHIRARATDIFMPDGKVITFWLYGDSEQHIRELLKQKSYKDIEWIKPVGDTLPFV
ncbi:MAG: hypothetical protein CBD58_01240 [bacterium TMED198]|nr:MAG: hypothetical protein CBD58_01240 [bacterium TMED198]|tara:strand:+ start:1965 stop:2171 length:207 start_codon:yes stop_codon:yes gene_type:complete